MLRLALVSLMGSVSYAVCGGSGQAPSSWNWKLTLSAVLLVLSVLGFLMGTLPVRWKLLAVPVGPPEFRPSVKNRARALIDRSRTR